MSENKFTPGPWRIDRDNQNVYANGLLAQTYGHAHTGEKLANANLISAAPEMFEALEIARDRMSDFPNDGQDIQWDIDLKKIDAAIKKAKGE